MKIAIAGKGGSGKTTLAGTLARLQARNGAEGLIAIDADSNPNLAITLGIPRERHSDLRPLDRQAVVKRETDDAGKQVTVLAMPLEEIVSQFGITASDGVTLMLMGRVEHAGAG